MTTRGFAHAKLPSIWFHLQKYFRMGMKTISHYSYPCKYPNLVTPIFQCIARKTLVWNRKFKIPSTTLKLARHFEPLHDPFSLSYVGRLSPLWTNTTEYNLQQKKISSSNSKISPTVVFNPLLSECKKNLHTIVGTIYSGFSTAKSVQSLN